ncbi:MAG: hypothetical protein ACTSVD_02190, partial [Candidatus Thorarchaeota archaeon]
AFLVRRGSRGTSIPVGVQRIIASTGDVSAGLAGTKKIKFIRTPADALVFLKIEENAIQQALAAVDYFAQKGEIDEVMKDKLLATYRDRLDAVRAAIAKDEDLKEIVDTSTAVDRARSDYLRKLAAMSGKAVAVESEAAGPPSVGMPSTTETAPSAATPAASPPGGGPPGGGPPGGGPPGGGPPGGGPPGGGPPSGATAAPSATPTPSPPGAAAPTGTTRPPGGAPKSSLQSEMLAEMERLKALMSGD